MPVALESDMTSESIGDDFTISETGSGEGQSALSNVVLALARSWRDLPGLSRYTGHAILLALLVLMAWPLVPADLPIPSLQLWQSPPAVGNVYPQEPVRMAAARTHSTRFLLHAAVPFTLRAERDSSPLPEAQPQQALRTSITTYTVSEGDTVLGIAEKFNLEGNSLLWANPKLEDNPDFLMLGQELVILPIDGAYHTVAAGESVENIAKTYKVKPESITEYPGNDLSAPYTLEAGQKLIIPGGTKPYVPRQVLAYSGESPKDAKKGSGHFVWPMSGYISQRYWEGHRAIDIAGSTGLPIVAADSGYVAVVQRSDVGYGRMVIIDHGNGYQTLYAHLSTYFVEIGQSVAKGETIGKCGSTGNSTGAHLHFEVIQGETRRNPLNYLP